MKNRFSVSADEKELSMSPMIILHWHHGQAFAVPLAQITSFVDNPGMPVWCRTGSNGSEAIITIKESLKEAVAIYNAAAKSFSK